MINYQGMLTDNSGNPLSGSYNLTFKIWTDTTGGSSLWTETQNGVQVTNGLFNVIMGKQTALNLAFDQQYWLEVGVGAETMPRLRFTSVGYAYRAEKTDTASYALTGPWGSNTTWTFLISDGADTTLRTGGRWGLARYGNGLYGTADSTHVNLGVACSTGASGQNRKYCTVGGGFRNVARDGWTTVGGGYANLTSGSYATVSGGGINQTYGDGATIGGGWINSVTGSYATIAGGQLNIVGGSDAAVGGGSNNVASAQRSTVSGGYSNQAAGDYSAILGGYGDTITSTGDYSYLFGIKSKLTQDSTFMVDMPHIYFGDEEDGYEFPPYDGFNGYVMQTNGLGRLSWVSASSTTGWTDGGTRVYLNSSSDSVGIGTSSPTRKLQVEGGVKFNRDNGELVLSTSSHNNPDRFKVKFDNNGVAPFVGDDTEDQYFDFYSGWSAIRAYNTHLKVHGSSATSSWGKYLEITHDGTDGKISTDVGDIILTPAANVGIGTTDPTSKLDINGPNGYSQLRLRQGYIPTGADDPHGNVGDIAYCESYLYMKSSSYGWRYVPLNSLSKSGTTVVADANGVLHQFSSSKRNAQDISKLETNPQEVLKLQPVKFTLKTTGQEEVGLIAEDVEQQIPDLVVYDKEGKPDAVKYDGVTLYLLELVKEQQKRIETLEAKLDKLESAH